MRSLWVTVLTFVAIVFGSPFVAPDVQIQVDKTQEKSPSHSEILTTLLKNIQTQRAFIDSTLDQYLGPIPREEAKGVALVVGSHFQNITAALWAAHSLLSSPGKKTIPLFDERGEPCDTKCIMDKTKGVVKETGQTAGKSVLKLGLNLLGKYISPAFLALSGIVVTLNAIVGGALAVLAGLVNGIFLTIAGGIAYLGHLVSDKDKERAGGPAGNVTLHVVDMIGRVLAPHLGL
ncbi:hypothetical protein Daus18300_009624 [Diaporthe australafricana]|uniref:Uncharacterized protein n=1 Tax=Diaporthe australafricana TaxID=127596 RepID=A0ABR3WDM8_9PEZI